jgi:hypothetical protein
MLVHELNSDLQENKTCYLLQGLLYCSEILGFGCRSLFKLNSDIHGFSKRYGNDFQLPSANLKLFQRGIFYSGIKTYHHLPKTIKELSHDVKKFRLALKRFIISNSFYSLEEYFDINWK